MRKLLKAILIAAVPSLLAILPAQAQSTRAQAAPSVRLRFLFLDDAMANFSLQTTAKSKRSATGLSFEPYMISAPVTLAPSEQFKLLRKAPAGSVETHTGEQAYAGEQAHSGTPAQQMQQTERTIALLSAPAVDSLIVLAPAADGSDGWKSLIFPDDAASFGEGSIRIINLGAGAMAAAFGKEQITLQPGQTRLVRPQLDARRRTRTMVGVQEQAATTGAEVWQLIYNSITTIPRGERVTGILVYSPSGLSFTYTDEQLAEMPTPAPGHFWLTTRDTTNR